MKTLGFLLLLLSFNSYSQESSFLVPKNYEKNDQFVKVESYFVKGFREKYFRYLSCKGSIEAHKCHLILKLNNIPESRLDQIKRSEQIKGTLLAGTELIGGGIIWKNLVKFSLPGFYKLVRYKTGWSEDIAVGSVALVPATLTSAGATVVALDQLNSFIETIDPLDRFRISSLVDKSDLTDNEVILVKYSYSKLIQKLNKILL